MRYEGRVMKEEAKVKRHEGKSIREKLRRFGTRNKEEGRDMRKKL